MQMQVLPKPLMCAHEAQWLRRGPRQGARGLGLLSSWACASEWSKLQYMLSILFHLTRLINFVPLVSCVKTCHMWPVKIWIGISFNRTGLCWSTWAINRSKVSQQPVKYVSIKLTRKVHMYKYNIKNTSGTVRKTTLEQSKLWAHFLR